MSEVIAGAWFVTRTVDVLAAARSLWFSKDLRVLKSLSPDCVSRVANGDSSGVGRVMAGCGSGSNWKALAAASPSFALWPAAGFDPGFRPPHSATARKHTL